MIFGLGLWDAPILAILLWLVCFVIVSLCMARRLKTVWPPITWGSWVPVAGNTFIESMIAGLLGFILGGIGGIVGMEEYLFDKTIAEVILYSVTGLLVILMSSMRTRTYYRNLLSQRT
jgi:hypothetical protein